MKYNQVPLIDAEISAVGFGCWAAGGGDIWNNTTDQDSIRAIQRAMELGINFFDVAPVYGLGHAEKILGEALRGRRQEVLIASKCSLVWDEAKNVTLNLTRESLFREIEDSLRRLNTDYIDLYQIHWPDPNTPIEETMGALADIKASGKIRYIGVSNFSLELTKEAAVAGEIVSHQGLYNLLERNPTSYHNIPLAYRSEAEMLPYCREAGMAFLPYSPLFQGLLTGKFKASGNFDDQDVRSANPKLSGETYQVYFEMAEKLKGFAAEIGRPLTQVAINWLINQEAVTSVICGAQTPEHVEENAGSADWDLTPEMVDRIEAILAPYEAEGLL
jgi:aryl-alcohol dehydrogenase-like predicted oxidoreductase